MHARLCVHQCMRLYVCERHYFVYDENTRVPFGSSTQKYNLEINMCHVQSQLETFMLGLFRYGF